jgi:hypothetical protein
VARGYSLWRANFPRISALLRSNSYEHLWLSAAPYGHYLTFPAFFIIPIRRASPCGGSWPIGPREWALATG